MFVRILVMTIAVAALGIPIAYSQETEKKAIDWRKVKVDCTRRMTKSKNGRNSRVQERREHITITTTIKSSLKQTLTGLQFHVYIIGETAALNRRNRKPVQGEDKLTKNITVEPYKKNVFEAIKSTLVEKTETKWRNNNNRNNNNNNNTYTVVSGQTFEGYVGLLKDSSDKLIMVKASNSQIRKIAQEMGIIPKDVEVDRHGMVAAPKPVKR